MSRDDTVWKIAVSMTATNNEAVAELMERIFHLPTVTHTNFETGRTSIAVYCDQRPSSFRSKRAALRNGLARLRAAKREFRTAKFSVRELRRENWAESWKRHFKPLEIGDALLVKPSWIKRRPKPGQAVVVLDPGLSFGTGQHATTSFCLRELVRRRESVRSQSFLDIGTGSGILAVAAAKLGYAPIRAFDADPASVRVARDNARTNRCQGKVRFSRRDLRKLPLRSKQQFDLICANLIANLLVAERDRILSRLRDGGVLVLAGILKAEFAEVRNNYRAAGLRLIASQVENKWKSASFLAGSC